MLMDIHKARAIDVTITEEDLKGYEIAIRNTTNNNFQNLNTRKSVVKMDADIVTLNSTMQGTSVGDTVEINGSKYNDGLYTVIELVGNTVRLDKDLYIESHTGAKLTKISYPADVIRGIKEIIKYDVKMADNKGVKSRTIARWSETYYDVNASDSVEGYPGSLFKFLDKYRRLRF